MRVIAPHLMLVYWVHRSELEDGSVREMLDPEDDMFQRHALVIEFRDARPVKLHGRKKWV